MSENSPTEKYELGCLTVVAGGIVLATVMVVVLNVLPQLKDAQRRIAVLEQRIETLEKQVR